MTKRTVSNYIGLVWLTAAFIAMPLTFNWRSVLVAVFILMYGGARFVEGRHKERGT